MLRSSVGAALLLGAAFSPAPAAADTLPQPPAQAITWGECTPKSAGLQCGTLSVPLNYADAGGQRISIAVIRKPAALPASRAGAIVFNPGGPGASGVEFLQGSLAEFEGQSDPVMAKLGQRFDLVSFDPRGVGASSPVKCGSLDALMNPGPVTIASVKADSVPYVAGCTKLSASLLPLISTADVARDLEQLRASLGDAKLNFLGYSYGTFLGATYAALFPGSVGKFVLDGAVDPDRYANRPLQDDLAQAVSGEVTFKRFLKSTKTSGKRISLKGFRKLLVRLEKKPAKVRGVKGVKRLTADDVRGYVSEGLTTRFMWAFVAMGVRGAMDGRPELIAAALKGSAEEAEKFIPGYFGNAGADRAVNAADVNDTYIASMRKVAPDVADFTWPTTLMQGLWPHSQGRFIGPWAYPAAAGPPILVIGTRFDPRTPYDGAVALRQQLGNARLLSFVGDGHTAFNNGVSSGCIDDHVIGYFTTATVPDDGTSCKQDKDVDDFFKELGDLEDLMADVLDAMPKGLARPAVSYSSP